MTRRHVPPVAAPIDAGQAAEYERCRIDIPYWINTYVYTYDPRPEAQPHHLPFRLYPFQAEYIQWLEARYRASEDGLIEKSRDMGVTWGGLAWLLHHWLFDGAFQALLGSRKEDLVDNPSSMDALFPRLHYIIERLPEWQKPARYDPKRHRQYLKLVNPANGNAIVGESANPNFARQGRYSVIWLDEFSFWEWGESVLRGTADASPTCISVSTPNGANHFKRLRFSGRIKTLTLHWRLHPHKTEEWYHRECAQRTEEDIAQELDISYDKSVRGRVYPEWQLIRRGDYPYMRGWPLYVSWDFGIGDDTALVWWTRNPDGGLWRVVDCYSSSGKTIDFYVPFIAGQMASGLPYRYTEGDLKQIRSHAGWGAAVHYGDPAGRQRNQVSGTSVIEELEKAGIYVQSRPDMNTFEARWQSTKLFLRRVEGVNEATCLGLHDAMSNARFPERRDASQATSEISKPIHDWTAHYRTACEYMAVNEPAEQMRDSYIAGRIRVGAKR